MNDVATKPNLSDESKLTGLDIPALASQELGNSMPLPKAS